MVKHQPLQVYERQLCLSCLTGIYGCRWKRYQRSHDDTTKWERLWSMILFGTFSLLLVWFYFWLEAHNDYNEFNWLLYNRSGEWSDGTVPILATTAAGFTYLALLMILALCHIAVGQQLNLHWLHKVSVNLITVVATGPFLHIGALAAITALAWLVAGQLARSERPRFQVVVALLYLAVLLGLYMAPLSISSPCIMQRDGLKARPAVIGQRGAPMLAPENTLLSFQKALHMNIVGLQADVAISLDGVPFLMRDRTLRRTTDVRRLFPERQHDDASSFNWTDLRTLNAGRWFLQDDPYWTVRRMSEQQRRLVGNQTVCSLEQLLQLVLRANRSILLTLHRPPQGHPHHLSWVNLTLATVLQSGIAQHQVVWAVDWDRELVKQEVPAFQQTSMRKQPVEALQQDGVSRLLLRYNQATAQDVRTYTASNLSVTLYTVNEPWLYSLLWCSGVQSVSSEAPQVLKKVLSPLWLMSPHEYCLIWVTTDLVSFALVLGIFVFQKMSTGMSARHSSADTCDSSVLLRWISSSVVVSFSLSLSLAHVCTNTDLITWISSK
uniref:GP-PDE domain-containing protein n=1 Tax=Electrophorus electricus TaxID=8005 RepID=A0A4W4GEV3_ELEEL